TRLITHVIPWMRDNMERVDLNRFVNERTGCRCLLGWAWEDEYIMADGRLFRAPYELQIQHAGKVLGLRELVADLVFTGSMARSLEEELDYRETLLRNELRHNGYPQPEEVPEGLFERPPEEEAVAA
ncbi:MAG: hypothetical protein GWN58_07325, partial [Anaerolineae bacterium]|nr:hypothetical protein [Anaerolineae bacterium]